MPTYPAVWVRNDDFINYTTQCSATVPVSIDLGSLSPGSDKTVEIPLMVSSPGLVRLRIDNDQGVITLKNAAGKVLSLNLSQYYNSADNTIRWKYFSDTTISARINVPKESALGLATVTGSFTLDCF
ncbi:hypothetical protein [Enterobacter asburiae]